MNREGKMSSEMLSVLTRQNAVNGLLCFYPKTLVNDCCDQQTIVMIIHGHWNCFDNSLQCRYCPVFVLDVLLTYCKGHIFIQFRGKKPLF